jgi:hypothetical protein
MDVQMEEQGSFKVQLRGHKEGLFCVQSKKKYGLENPYSDGRKYEAYVEFANDVLVKATPMQKLPSGEFVKKHVLL